MDKQYTRHYLSEIWPDMEPAAFDELTEDIRRRGCILPILVVGNEIIDGWHRYQACRIMEIEPEFQDIPTDKVLLPELAISLNSRRRHMTESQIAASALLAHEWQPVEQRPTHKEIAKEAGVSRKTVDRAAKGMDAGYGEEITSGQMSARHASDLADQEQSPDPAPAPAPANKLTPIQLRLKQLAERVNELEEEKGTLKAALELADYSDANQTEQERIYAESQRKLKYETDRANALQNELATEKKGYRGLLHSTKKMREELHQLNSSRVTEGS